MMTYRWLAIPGSLCLLSILLAVAPTNGNKALHDTPNDTLDFQQITANAQTGSTSDELQALIDRGGESVLLPPGTHVLDRTLEIDLDQVGPVSISGSGDCRLVMNAAGPAIRFVGTHEGTANPDSVLDNVWDRQRMPMVDGLEIIGGHPEADGIHAIGTMQLTISRVVIRKARHGIRLIERNRNVIIIACHIYENSGIGIYYDDVNLHQSNIGDCHISYNREGGVVVRGGDVRNVHIGNCDIEGNMEAGGVETANVLFDSRGGSMGEASITGCTIQHSHDAESGANIRVIGTSTPRDFTDETRHGHVTITGNVLSDVEYNVDLSHTRAVTVVGNTMWKGYVSDIRVRDSQSVVISDNVFDRNPRYHYGDGDDSRDGILLERTIGATLVGNHFDGIGDVDAMIQATDCQYLNISACTLLGFAERAIQLSRCRACTISACLLGRSTSDESDPDDWIELDSCEEVILDGTLRVATE